MYQGPESGTWQRVQTAHGWHLRLVGANGEPVVTSEVYTDPRTVEEALVVVLRATSAYSRPTMVAAQAEVGLLLQDVYEYGD